MKTRFPLLIATLFAVAAIQVVHAQDDVYGPGSNTSTQAKPTKHNGKKITTGYVFIDGKYVEPPYEVKRKGMSITINGKQILKMEVPKSKYNFKKRPQMPIENLTAESGLSEIFEIKNPENNEVYIYVIQKYYLEKYPFEIACDSIKSVFISLPNVMSVENANNRKDEFTIMSYNGESRLYILSLYGRKYSQKFGPNRNEQFSKNKLVSNADGIIQDICENIVSNKMIFFFTDSNIPNTPYRYIISNENCSQVYRILQSNYSYNQKLDSLKPFFINHDLLKKLLDKYQKTDKIKCSSEDFKRNKAGFNNPGSLFIDVNSDKVKSFAYSPGQNEIMAWCPNPWEFIEFSVEELPNIIEYTNNQGYNCSPNNIFVDNSPGDCDFESCTYENLVNMRNAGLLYISCHGDQNNGLYLIFASDPEYIYTWSSYNSNIQVGQLAPFDEWGENEMWAGRANAAWATENWSDQLQSNNTLSVLSTCFSNVNGWVEACSGGICFGYNEASHWGWFLNQGINYNNRNLFKRMNGLLDNATKREAVDAYLAMSNHYDGFTYRSNTNITLCPSTKTIFPANNSIVPSAVTQGYFEIDTWCDATIPANQALTFSTTGNIQINANTGVYWENGTSGKSNKIIYEWTGTQGSVTVHVHTDKIVAYGGGGQRLDFDRVAPNGETGVYYVFQIGSGTAQYVDFFAENTNILENTPVQFTNTSSLDDPISYNWDFGDGGTSNQQNPVHAYTTSGVYDVSLTVATPIGNLYKGKTSYISVYNESSGDLSCTNFVLYDKTVQFNASFIGAYEPYAFEYRFTIDYGDGNTDTQQGISPFADFTYEYMEYADYETTVFVEVLSQFDDVIYAVGCDCGNVGLYNPFPCSNFEADFTYSPEIGYLTGGSQNHSVTINFYNSTSGGTNYSGTWYFLGDLENDYEPLGGITNEGFVEAWGHNGNPQPKTYTQPGIYPVALDVWDQNGCFDNITKYIHIEEPLHCINNLKIHSSGSDQLWNSNRLIVPWMHNNHDCSINLFHDFNLTTFCAHCDCATCGERPQRYRWYVNGEKIVEGIDDGATIILGHSYETDFELSTQQYILPYKNTVSCTIEGDLFHTVSDNFSSSCYDSTHIELIAIYCDGFMNSNDFNFARMAHSNPLLPPFTEHGFMINNGNTKEFFSGTMALNYGVNTVVGNHDVVLYACNEIVLTDGFIAGNRSFVAYAGIDGNTIEGCHQIQYANNRIADKVSEVDMETKKRASLDVVPNPVSENFRVVVNHPFDDFLLLQIFDSHGRFIQELSNSNQTAGFCVFQVTNFNVSPGLYFCRYTNSQNSITRKFIKKQTHDK